MKKIVSQFNPSSVPFATPYPGVSQAVAALTQRQLDRLLAIARQRLQSLTRSYTVERLWSQCEPLEYVHDTILLVLLGELKPGEGRHTHVRHLADHRTFFNFLQGVLHSRISAALKRESNATNYQPPENELGDARTLTQDVVLNEVTAGLLARLQAVAGNNPALQATFSWLELEAPNSSHQPTRKQIHKMRKVGRELLRELAAGAEVQDLFLA